MSSHKVARKSLTFHLSCVRCGRLDIFLTGQVTTHYCVKKVIHECLKLRTYLPVIDASATELSTINAVLQRSSKIADEWGLQYVCLVFDEAIYSKIQQIRWKDVTYINRFVIRMGAFHMAMAFYGAIGKLFGDGGLKVRPSLIFVSLTLTFSSNIFFSHISRHQG